MINAEFLASCTDEQINRGVAWIQIAGSVDKAMASENVELYRYGMNYDMSVPRHYCTSPSDIMPIAFNNRIGLDSLFSGKWVALSPSWSSSGIESTNKNPLRAICEVYILMSVNK